MREHKQAFLIPMGSVSLNEQEVMIPKPCSGFLFHVEDIFGIKNVGTAVVGTVLNGSTGVGDTISFGHVPGETVFTCKVKDILSSANKEERLSSVVRATTDGVAGCNYTLILEESGNSYAGKRLGLEDTRGTLFYHYAIFLEKLQPKLFLFENVRGLLTHDNGKTYSTILNIFERCGYEIQKEVLNAWDYGVAQKRERLITVGIRKDLSGKINFTFPKKHNYKPVLRDVLQNVPSSIGVSYGEDKRRFISLKMLCKFTLPYA